MIRNWSWKSLSLAAPLLLAFATAWLMLPATASAELRAVASIKPVHSLASAIMQGAGNPHLLVGGNASPHAYSLKPSDAAALESADLVFWIGEGLERFLVEPLETLAARARLVELGEAEGVALLDVREGGIWDRHDDDDHGKASHSEADHGKESHGEAGHSDHGHSDHDTADMHLWLDPLNAKAMARAMVEALAAADAGNAELYRRNGAALTARLDRLITDMDSQLATVRDRPFLVFHDAYQYLEKRFALNAVGSITVAPDIQPGAARLSDLRHRITERGAVCVFSEPQFPPKLAGVVIEGTEVRTGVLDPLGAALPDGPELYFTMMENNARALTQCLSGT